MHRMSELLNAASATMAENAEDLTSNIIETSGCRVHEMQGSVAATLMWLCRTYSLEPRDLIQTVNVQTESSVDFFAQLVERVQEMEEDTAAELITERIGGFAAGLTIQAFIAGTIHGRRARANAAR